MQNDSVDSGTELPLGYRTSDNTFFFFSLYNSRKEKKIGSLFVRSKLGDKKRVEKKKKKV